MQNKMASYERVHITNSNINESEDQLGFKSVLFDTKKK